MSAGSDNEAIKGLMESVLLDHTDLHRSMIANLLGHLVPLVVDYGHQQARRAEGIVPATLLDGSPTTCSSEFNRGHDAGYLEGMKVPVVKVPRWDEDPAVIAQGWNTPDRCGKCGEPRA